MEKQIFGNKEGKELLEMLEANCDAVEEMHYQVILSAEELVESKNIFAKRSIEEARIEQEKKDAVEKFKTQLDPIKKEKKILLDEIKTQSRSEFGRVYKIVDMDAKETGFYNNRGQLVYSRPANQDERTNMTITHSIRKAQ